MGCSGRPNGVTGGGEVCCSCYSCRVGECPPPPIIRSQPPAFPTLLPLRSHSAQLLRPTGRADGRGEGGEMGWPNAPGLVVQCGPRKRRRRSPDHRSAEADSPAERPVELSTSGSQMKATLAKLPPDPGAPRRCVGNRLLPPTCPWAKVRPRAWCWPGLAPSGGFFEVRASSRLLASKGGDRAARALLLSPCLALLLLRLPAKFRTDPAVWWLPMLSCSSQVKALLTSAFNLWRQAQLQPGRHRGWPEDLQPGPTGGKWAHLALANSDRVP